MKVSIVIPVYNVSNYVERCLNSVMTQTYTDLECIIVDDCTPDDSIEKCERMIAQYNGPIEFKILHHGRNRGLSAARNTGTNAAKGEYIYYLDSDDEITKDCIIILVAEAQKDPTIELVQGGNVSIPHNESLAFCPETSMSCFDSNDQIRFLFFSGRLFPVTAWNKLVRKDFLTSNHLSFKEGIIHEDCLWTFQLVRKINKLVIIAHTTYIYYKTDNSITSTTSKLRTAKNMMFITRIALRELDEPYKSLQLYFHLLNLLYHLEYSYNSVEGVKASIASICTLIRCGYHKLAICCIKKIFFMYIQNDGGLIELKDNLKIRWNNEIQNVIENKIHLKKNISTSD